MKLTKRAKQKWFKENVNQFELYYDCFKNVRLAQYDAFWIYATTYVLRNNCR